MLYPEADIEQIMRAILEKTHLEHADHEAILAEEMGVSEAETFELIHALEDNQDSQEPVNTDETEE